MILQKEINNRVATMIIIVALLFSVVGVKIAYARTNNSDNVVALAQTQDNVSARMILPAGTVATSTVLVDLSDSTNFRHTGASLEVSMIRFAWTTEVIATTTIRVGVVASTSPAGNVSDVYWFDEVSFSSTVSNQFNGRQEKVLDYQPSVVKLGILSNLPAGYITGDTKLNTTSYATTTKLKSPNGYINPAVGDLVMDVYDQKGTATTSVTVIYRAK